MDAGIVYAAWLGLAAALMTAATVRSAFVVVPLTLPQPLQLGGTALLCGLCSYLSTGNGDGAALATMAALVLAICVRAGLPRLTAAGVLKTMLLPLTALFGWMWAYALVGELGAPDWLLTALRWGMALAVPLLGLLFAETLAREALVTHALWRRPIASPGRRRRGGPKVSIHLPSYAEPPEIVIAVLDRLSHLDYDDFEVLVCDNNTPDEALWRPLARHCDYLNRVAGTERFRFFHVAPLAGAKAGALNYLLDRTARDAELVGVIDADYLAQPDFLSRLVAFFDDPVIGYIQTPHDYRGWEESAYLTACHWEYMPSNKVELSGVSEYGAAYTIGTMCLIRRDALEAAGRWAEWCLTEDSEVSIRLRAIGAQGLYLRDTFGRGLIPETFDDYKKQRFRWTAGPVQQIRRHWRLFLPCILGGSTEMGGWSKLLEVRRGIAPLGQLVGVIAIPAAAIVQIGLVASGHGTAIILPQAAWLATLLGLGAWLTTTWTRYRLAGCLSVGEMAMGEIARMSLTYVQVTSGIAGLSRRPLAWRRTPKFKAVGRGLSALGSAMPETAVGLAHLVLALLLMAGMSRTDDAVLLAVLAMIWSGARFLAAPAMALMSERHLAGRGARVERLREVSARQA